MCFTFVAIYYVRVFTCISAFFLVFKQVLKTLEKTTDRKKILIFMVSEMHRICIPLINVVILTQLTGGPGAHGVCYLRGSVVLYA